MDERLTKFETKMQKSLDNLAGEYAAIRHSFSPLDSINNTAV